MDAVTHALAPVIIARLGFRRSLPVGRFGYPAIGLAGALPDLLAPHLTLEERMESWSHGLPFWLLFTLLAISVPLLFKKSPLRLSCALSSAYLLHLVCDAVSGGVNWLFPVRDFVWGQYWVSPLLWPLLDILLILQCYLLFRYLPLRARRRQAE